ncbi:interferon alpha-inducible protein 27, mitochondrial-like [Ylistrum balloti]|uniref:interferon alpha-inducible protein 27, mitochondrial-like n=1 Tax=Ylistrum balloti TaxID=509963 RepID=UPI002905DDF9|nr:interferon alpha-inducible protein 27, mitochondrial-like [Ylistrum balloti]
MIRETRRQQRQLDIINHELQRAQINIVSEPSDTDDTDAEEEDNCPRNLPPEPKKFWTFKKKLGLSLLGGVAAVVATPLVLGAVGFTSTGILAGSLAAKAMSAAAIANGGGVAAGSAVAICQSVGAAGLGATGVAAVGSTGTAVTLGTVTAVEKLTQKDK